MIGVSDDFHAAAVGQIIQPIAGLYISFNKDKSPDVGFFTLDQSRLSNIDLLAPLEDNPIQLWDTYDYKNYTDRLVSVEWSRSIEFPYQVQSALADVTLSNTDGYFTPNSASSIADDNLPKRPLKIYAGYKGVGMIQQLVGLTQEMPTVDNGSRTVSYHVMDFLDEIGELELSDTIAMRNVRTDEVLVAIIEQFGILPSQYNFEHGTNLIPFVFFDKGQAAGEAIRQLIQAEGGKLWLDGSGILRFKARSATIDEPAMSFDNPGYELISVAPSSDARIVNRVKISADIREVQEWQTVYSKTSSGDSTSTNLWVVPAGGTFSIDAGLEDPCYDIIAPTQGHATSVSWFTCRTSDGTEVKTGVSAAGELTTNAYKLTFTNTNSVAVEIDTVTLWGEPAKVTDHIDYDAYEDESLEKYGEQLLEINDNPFFQTYGQCRAYGNYILREYADYGYGLDIQIKGDFSSQLGDAIEIDGEYGGSYQIDSLAYKLTPGNLITTMKVHKYIQLRYFTLNKSILDGPDILGQENL